MGVWPEPRFHDAEGGTALPRIPGPWPAVNLIQVETELSERAVRKALRELRDKGLIALGDQELAAVDFHGDVVPVNRRPKVWTLRLDASTESFNGVERAEDVQTAYTGRSVRS